jgi:histidine triad (HIT) family protein
MDDCIFCKIVKGELPSFKTYEDDEFIAFLSIAPICEGYTLVIPKKHYRWVWDVENIGRYFEVCQKVAKKMQEVNGKDSIYSMTLGQEVPHAHVRIFADQDDKFIKEIGALQEKLEYEIDFAKGKDIAEKYKVLS